MNSKEDSLWRVPSYQRFQSAIPEICQITCQWNQRPDLARELAERVMEDQPKSKTDLIECVKRNMDLLLCMRPSPPLGGTARSA